MHMHNAALQQAGRARTLLHSARFHVVAEHVPAGQAQHQDDCKMVAVVSVEVLFMFSGSTSHTTCTLHTRMSQNVCTPANVACSQADGRSSSCMMRSLCGACVQGHV